ncbi:MAG: alpha/beta hydrolase family protein [Chloroflexota bacterium]|nr:alpha/beta hydrolase family protein [Chloroflexota bacterium]
MSPDMYTPTLASETRRRFAFQATDQAGARQCQREFRAELENMLGLHHIEERGPAPLTARMLSSEQLPGHIREEWTLETEPGFHVGFYLLRPLAAAGRNPLVITPHGHGGQARREYVGLYASDADRARIEAEELDVALQAVQEGYIALAPDMRAFANLRLPEDIQDGMDNSCRTLAMRALLFGRTLLGERVWDVRRLIDWAVQRDDVDPNAIVITGNSGGGTVTLFTGATDERVRVCVPVCYFCTFEASIGSIKHCECNYVPRMLQCAEMYDVAALVAPRPFLAVNGAQDPIFPIQATRDSFARLRDAYRVWGCQDSCKLGVGEDGHRYYKRLVWPFVREALAG